MGIWDGENGMNYFPLGEEQDGSFGAVSTETGSFVDDELSNWSEEDSDGKNRYIGVTVSRWWTRFAFLCMAFSLLVVAARAGQVQVLEGDFYAAKAEGNRSRIEWLPAERGVIYDRNGVPLVRNVPVYSVSVVPADLPKDKADRREILGRLADILSLNPLDIELKLGRYSEGSPLPVHVAEDIGHEEAVLTEILSAEWPAVQLFKESRREYPQSVETASLSHLLGYDGSVTEEDLEGDSDYLPTDRRGRAGLELEYESTLRGDFGRRRVEVDALGRRKKIIAEEPSVPGGGLVTTLDLEVQEVAERALRNALETNGKKRGSVIVMDPSTGELLAVVSLPSYDNNKFARGISSDEYAELSSNPDKPLFPRAVGASLPSGSTFKLVVAAAMLAEEVITPRTTVLSAGGIAVSTWFFPDWKAGGHGITDVYKAISESVNTFFYVFGGGYEGREGLGVDRMMKYADLFGFGRPTGVDLPGEGSGFLPSREWKERVKGERWYVGDTYHLAIGQGDILVTPMQVAAMTAAFANGGSLVRPHAVRAVTSADGTRQDVETAFVEDQVVPAEHVETVREGMRHSVLYGSSRGLSLLPVSAAGKTGTAQWSSLHHPHAWFTSFAPFDEPEIVVTVAVEEGEEGSRVAVPVAREIMEAYFAGRE